MCNFSYLTVKKNVELKGLSVVEEAVKRGWDPAEVVLHEDDVAVQVAALPAKNIYFANHLKHN